MRTMVINVTQTTEDDVWNHLMKKIDEYIKEADEIKAKQEELITYIHDKNPYANFSWRNGRKPSRVKWDEWMGGSEECMETMVKHFDFRHDWTICSKAFGWDNPENERFEETDYWDFMIRTKHSYSMVSNDEFDFYERKHYEDSRKEWEIKDAEWIKEEDFKNIHKRDHKKDRDDCKYCIQENESDRQYEIRQKRDEEQQRIWNEEFRQKKNQEKLEKEQTKELYKCDVCNYKTYDDNAWDAHEDSKDHKKLMDLKKFRCESCDVQCRNQAEYTIHNQTKKHKIAIGEIEKQSQFVCTLCNYTTELKQNYDKHLKTKNHKEKEKE